MVERPFRHIVTFRVTDEEKVNLDKLASEYGESISTLMRDILIHSLENKSVKMRRLENSEKAC